MTTVLTSARIGRPSSVVQTTVTDQERVAFSTRDIDFAIDPAEVAQEFFGLTLRDRVRGLPVTVTSGTASTLNSNPAIDFADTGRMTADYTVPASYFIAAVASQDTVANTYGLVTSANDDDNRLFFGGLTSGQVRLDHGTTSGNSLTGAATVTGTHIFWASYDADSGVAEIGFDAVAALATGTLAQPQKGWPQTCFFGNPDNSMWSIDGKGQTVLICDRYIGGSANYLTRQALLAWPASQAGISLGS